MAFQLVRASDSDIAVWQTDQGHVYLFQVAADARTLVPLMTRPAPGAAEPAESFLAEALDFATLEAAARDMITPPSSHEGARASVPRSR